MRRLLPYLFALVVGLLAICAGLAARAQNVPSFQAALTNAQVAIKPTGGSVDGVACANTNAAIVYLQFFNSATAVTLGTTAPYLVVPLVASGVTNTVGIGARFGVGIRVAATAGAANAVAPAAPVACSIIVR